VIVAASLEEIEEEAKQINQEAALEENPPKNLFSSLKEKKDSKEGKIQVKWIKDSERSSIVNLCGTTFSVLKRRHHCRACGEMGTKTAFVCKESSLNTYSIEKYFEK